MLAALCRPTGILTEQDLALVVQQAISNWLATGISSVLAERLANAQVRIADLPEGILGMTERTTITIDSDADGRGWFVDPTPGDDSEFIKPGDQGEQKNETVGHRPHEMPDAGRPCRIQGSFARSA